jgi:hypothetical protein
VPNRTISPRELEIELTSRLAAIERRRGSRPRRRSRGRARTKFVGLAGVISLLLVSVSGVFADGGALNVQIADKTGYAADTTTDGAIVEYIGDSNTTFGASGSGIFESFLQTQDTPSEEGYNTDGIKEFDTGSSPTFNHSILVSEIPVVACESLDGSETTAGLCWELFADINDSNANDPEAKQIQLTDLEIWFTLDSEITGYDQGGTGFGADADKTYDFNGAILINDVNQGSGRGDLRYLIPLSGISFPVPADCDYGSSTCDTYFVVYTEWGDPADGAYKSDSGFEEWKVKKYPFLEVSKTATTTFTRTFPWTITKSVTPDTWALFDGDSGTSDYTVALTKGTGVDSAWAVSGTITIENTSDQDAVITAVTDTISGVGAIAVNCGVGFALPYELDEGDTLVCTYSSALPDGSARTNTATATLVDGPVFSDDAAITFGSPTTLVNDTVHVDDTFAGGPQDQAFSASGQATYSRTFACGADEGTHNNTATITETGQNDSASVTVTCYDLTVTKTAVESFSRDFDWTIEKSVDPESLDMFDGDSGDVTWTVVWTKSAAQDAGYAVEGEITVTNNHPSLGAVINSVTDVIAGPIAPTVDCGVVFPYTIAAGGSLVCDYDSSLPDNTTRLNTATATQQNYDYASNLTATAAGTTQYSGTASIDFTGVAPTVTDDTATITDDRGPLNQNESTSGSTSYDETFECGEDEGEHTNTAVVTEDDSLDSDSDDATTTVNCYQLTVSKDADTSFDRDYDWTIAKTRVFAEGELDGDLDPTTLTLDPDQTYTLTYEITVDLDNPAFTDSNWAVEGTITVNNPAPIAADDVVVTDNISGYGPADSLDCDAVTAGEQTTVDIAAGGSVICAYSAALPDATTRTNTATATLFGIGYDGTASIDFGTADVTEIDECVVVTDDNGTPGDTSDDTVLDASLCANEAPHTYTNTIEVGPFEICGEFTFTNTAHIVAINDANDTGENHSASYTVIITVPCPEGCTLTPGYWKTHNEEFWGGAANKADPTWYLEDLDGDGLFEGPNEMFFDTGMTWFEVLWESPAGRPYFQLAFQYAAAYLNKLSIEDQGGTIPAGVQDAIDDAAALLDQYDQQTDIKGKDAKAIRSQFVTLAGILGSFNEGTYPGGPLHCDEDASSSLTLSSAASVTQSSAGFVLLPFGLLPFGIGVLRRRRSKR